MKKISIIFAVLAIFMLLASCSNAAGEVDLAGNPVELTGTWEGSVAYKGDLDYVRPISCTGTGGNYTDYAGTYVVDEANQTPHADWDQISIIDETTYTYKHLYYVNTITTKTTTVVNSDGSFTETKVVTETQTARAAQPAATDTWYYVHYTNGSSPAFAATAPAQTAGTATTTTTKTYSAPVKNLAGTYDVTITTKTDSVKTGALVVGAASTSSTVINHNTYTSFQSLLTSSVDIEDRTVEPTLEPVAYSNDILETVSFVVANDGTYTLTTTIVETQAAREAAAATETNYAVPALEAATKTVTYSFTGTVAAWGGDSELKMAMSSTTKEVTVEEEGDMLDETIPGTEQLASRFAAPSEKSIRFFNGKGKKDDVVKTRMYVSLDSDGDSSTNDECVIILDKAAEEEE